MTQGATQQQFGASTWLCDYIVQHQLQALKPQQVVDFGAGGGKNGRLVRQVLGKDCELIAVEGFERAAEMLQKIGEYDRVDTALLQEWVDRDSHRYSLAIFGDVIEHMTPSEIHHVIRRCFSKFAYIVIVVPLHDIYQDEAYGNPLEVHKAYITENFFDRYKPIEKHIVESGEFTIMNLLIPTCRSKDVLYRQFARRLFHVLMLGLQPLGLARPLVDVLKRAVGRYKWMLR